MTLYEHELKNAYIGEYVQPYEYSYDFTTGSTTDLQNKGWTVGAGSVVNSNGYYNSSRNWQRLSLSSSELSTAVLTAKKLTLTFVWSATGNHQRAFSLVENSTENTVLYGDGGGHTGGNQATFGGESLFNESIVYGNSGTFTNTLEVDIENKTWKYEGTSHTTLNGTISDAQISAFRGINGIWVYGESYAYIRSIYIKIES